MKTANIFGLLYLEKYNFFRTRQLLKTMVIENRSLNTRPLFIDSLTEIFNYHKPKFTYNFSYKFISTAGISNGNSYFLSVLVCNDVKIIATQLLFNRGESASV